MIGTRLIEELVQSVALSHRVKGYPRVSLLLLAAPESGKTTITTAANCKHVCRVAIMSGRSILREVREHPDTEFLLFNDLTAIRAMSYAAVNLAVVLLNQITQNETGLVAFAGKETETITRPIGIIGCLPFSTFVDHRSRWNELGFISRMVPFAYQYPRELVARIKDTIDVGTHSQSRQPSKKMPSIQKKPIAVSVSEKIGRQIRHVADARAEQLEQTGIRLLQNYHALTRAHALSQKRRTVTKADLQFLRDVDRYVSITATRPLRDERS